MRLLTSAKKSLSQSQSKLDPTSANATASTDDASDSEPEPTHATSTATPSILPLLSPDRTRANISVSSRKRALEHACEILAGCNDLNARQVLDALLTREKLGSTALGDGVAIPHCRLEDCTAPVGVLLTLDQPIDYDAPDDKHVDLLFALVVPKNADDEHLKILSQLAGILVLPENRDALRQAQDHQTLFEHMQTLANTTE